MYIGNSGFRIKLTFPFFASAAFILIGEMRKNFLLAFLFSLFHEIGHIIPIFLSKGKIREIAFDLGGIKIEKEAAVLSYKAECIASLTGPSVNLIFAVIFSFFISAFPFAKQLFLINIALFAVNMLPVRALDGGRFLYSFFSMYKGIDAANKIIAISSVLTSILIVLLLFLMLLFHAVNTSFVFFAVGLAAIAASELVKA